MRKDGGNAGLGVRDTGGWGRHGCEGVGEGDFAGWLPEHCRLLNALKAGRLGCGEPEPVLGRGHEKAHWAQETTQGNQCRSAQLRVQPVDRPLNGQWGREVETS